MVQYVRIIRLTELSCQENHNYFPENFTATGKYLALFFPLLRGW